MRLAGLRGLTATYGSTSAFTYAATRGTGPLQSAWNGEGPETRASGLCVTLAVAPGDANPADAPVSASTPTAALITVLRDHIAITSSGQARPRCPIKLTVNHPGFAQSRSNLIGRESRRRRPRPPHWRRLTDAHLTRLGIARP